jgi:hypothetical protein
MPCANLWVAKVPKKLDAMYGYSSSKTFHRAFAIISGGDSGGQFLQHGTWFRGRFFDRDHERQRCLFAQEQQPFVLEI